MSREERIAEYKVITTGLILLLEDPNTEDLMKLDIESALLNLSNYTKIIMAKLNEGAYRNTNVNKHPNEN